MRPSAATHLAASKVGTELERSWNPRRNQNPKCSQRERDKRAGLLRTGWRGGGLRFMDVVLRVWLIEGRLLVVWVSSEFSQVECRVAPTRRIYRHRSRRLKNIFPVGKFNCWNEARSRRCRGAAFRFARASPSGTPHHTTTAPKPDSECVLTGHLFREGVSTSKRIGAGKRALRGASGKERTRRPGAEGKERKFRRPRAFDGRSACARESN